MEDIDESDIIREYGSDYFKEAYSLEKKEEQEEVVYSKDKFPIARDVMTGKIKYLDIKETCRIYLYGINGCVDADTEFLTRKGWKKISEYRFDDDVMQYDVDDGSGEFVRPLKYIKLPCDKMYHFKNTNGLDQCLSPEHRVIYLQQSHGKEKLKVKTMQEIYDVHMKYKTGFTGRFLKTFLKSGGANELKDDEIRLITACIADGTLLEQKNKIAFNLKKKRKIGRLKALLDRLNITYSEQILSTTEYSRISFYWHLVTKEYDNSWYDASYSQLKVFAEESLHWDGSVADSKGRRARFSTTNKDSANFIQYAFTAIGKRASICASDRIDDIHKSIEYTVCISKTKTAIFSHAGMGEKLPINIVKPKDGMKYCFEVPSGCLVLRRNDRIFITKNSGKTFLMRTMVDRLLQLGHCAAYITDPKDEMKSSNEKVQMKFRKQLLKGEIPRSTPVVSLRPTFFKPAEQRLPENNYWYSVDLKRLQENDFMTLLRTEKMTMNQQIAMGEVFKSFKQFVEEGVDMTVNIFDEIIDEMDDMRDKDKQALKFKFKGLKESNFFNPDYEIDLIDLIKKGYVPSTNLDNFRRFEKSNYKFPDVLLNIMGTELIEARNKGEIPPLWLMIDEAKRFMGTDINSGFRFKMEEAAELYRRTGVYQVFVSQTWDGLDDKVLSQCRYFFIPKLAEPDVIRKAIVLIGAAKSHPGAQKKAMHYKMLLRKYDYVWLLCDRNDGSISLIRPLPPLSKHMETSN